MWEISQKTVLKMAADRGAYIDQSQSLNIHIAEPNYGKLTSMHFYGWKLVSQQGNVASVNLYRWKKNPQKTLLPFSWSVHIFFCSAGSENGDVLPAHEACSQSHPVHPQQGEAEGDQVEHKRRGGGGQRAQHRRDGLLAGKQRGLHDVRLLIPEPLVHTEPYLTALYPPNASVNILEHSAQHHTSFNFCEIC